MNLIQTITALSIVAVGFAETSCQAPRAGQPDYSAWVRDYDHGMHVRHLQNDLAFDLQYQPAELVWTQRNGGFDADAFEQQRRELEQMSYFTLDIRSQDGTTDIIALRSQGDVQLASELQYYFAFRFQNDISIKDGVRELPCTLFHFEQYGTKSFVLGFDKGDEPLGEVTLVINSSVLDQKPVNIKVSTDPNAL